MLKLYCIFFTTIYFMETINIYDINSFTTKFLFLLISSKYSLKFLILNKNLPYFFLCSNYKQFLITRERAKLKFFFPFLLLRLFLKDFFFFVLLFLRLFRQEEFCINECCGRSPSNFLLHCL